jgi:hydroxymethylpyrimidine/phosphomethylpyrimidine kinase
MSDFPKVCVTIGASAAVGAAGIQADLKTFTALSCYGAAAVTAIAAQTFAGIQEVEPVSDRMLRAQLDAIAAALPVAAVKVGLCPTAGTVRVISRWLSGLPRVPVVVDPVVADSRGIPMQQPETIRAVCDDLLPRATVATPNRFEAAALAGMEECLSVEDMEAAARLLSRRHGCAVVVTGGGLSGRTLDVLAAMDGISHFDGPTHPRGKVSGIGCTHAAAVAAGLAKGDDLRDALLHAKLYVGAAIQAAPQLPDGRPVLWHGVTVREQVIVDPSAGPARGD